MAIRVLEFVRSPEYAVWNLPAARVDDLRREFPAVRFDSPATREEALALLPEADVVLGFLVRPESLPTARKLRWIHVTSAAVGGVLFPELVASDVVLTNSRGLHADSMAEHALGLLFMFARKLHVARDAQARREWLQAEMWTADPPYADVAGSTLGIVGLGAIGSALATRARALGMKVIAIRRRPTADPAPADAQWGPERLDEMLSLSDFVVLAPPLTPGTKGMIDAGRLARLRPHAVLINLGRGSLVDERAMIAALESGRLAGAGLDVTEEEPLPKESPLWSLPNVILTPHVSGLGPRLWERAMELFARNLHAFAEGRPLENVVDKAAGY